jgi:hypothetical protein
MIDVERDKILGDWKSADGAISTPGAIGKPSFLLLPVTIKGGYDLAVEFTRLRGVGFIGFVLPVGATQCDIELSAYSGYCSGIQAINGIAVQSNIISRRPGTLSNGQKHSVVISVRLKDATASITAVLDGRPYVGWTGNQSSLTSLLNPVCDLQNPQCPKIGSSRDPAVFHSIKMKMLSSVPGD